MKGIITIYFLEKDATIDSLSNFQRFSQNPPNSFIDFNIKDKRNNVIFLMVS